jgi:hypothetical protein
MVGQPAAQTENLLVNFGDIHLSQHWLVTPSGTHRLKGTQLHVTDLTQRTVGIPAWAIVLAVIGAFFFLLGLLFLLVKETRVTGFFQITVTNGNFSYQSLIPANQNYQAQFVELQNRANFARTLIAAD